MKHNGRKMKSITAGELYTMDEPEDMEDAWVRLPGRLSLTEVWDCGIELDDGKVVLFGNFPDTSVPLDHPIYYTDFSEE